jgi:thymidylate synthase
MSRNDIKEFRFEDFIIENYQAYPHIKGDISV